MLTKKTQNNLHVTNSLRYRFYACKIWICRPKCVQRLDKTIGELKLPTLTLSKRYINHVAKTRLHNLLFPIVTSASSLFSFLWISYTHVIGFELTTSCNISSSSKLETPMKLGASASLNHNHLENLWNNKRGFCIPSGSINWAGFPLKFMSKKGTTTQWWRSVALLEGMEVIHHTVLELCLKLALHYMLGTIF